MIQKFRTYTFVQVTKEMPSYMRHFQSGFVGIVQYTYGQMYGGDASQFKEYSLLVVEDDKVVNSTAWYKEDQLTALPDSQQDTLKAEEMLENYRLRR